MQVGPVPMFYPGPPGGAAFFEVGNQQPPFISNSNPNPFPSNPNTYGSGSASSYTNSGANAGPFSSGPAAMSNAPPMGSFNVMPSANMMATTNVMPSVMPSANVMPSAFPVPSSNTPFSMVNIASPFNRAGSNGPGGDGNDGVNPSVTVNTNTFGDPNSVTSSISPNTNDHSDTKFGSNPPNTSSASSSTFGSGHSGHPNSSDSVEEALNGEMNVTVNGVNGSNVSVNVSDLNHLSNQDNGLSEGNGDGTGTAGGPEMTLSNDMKLSNLNGNTNVTINESQFLGNPLPMNMMNTMNGMSSGPAPFPFAGPNMNSMNSGGDVKPQFTLFTSLPSYFQNVSLGDRKVNFQSNPMAGNGTLHSMNPMNANMAPFQPIKHQMDLGTGNGSNFDGTDIPNGQQQQPFIPFGNNFNPHFTSEPFQNGTNVNIFPISSPGQDTKLEFSAGGSCADSGANRDNNNKGSFLHSNTDDTNDHHLQEGVTEEKDNAFTGTPCPPSMNNNMNNASTVSTSSGPSANPTMAGNRADSTGPNSSNNTNISGNLGVGTATNFSIAPLMNPVPFNMNPSNSTGPPGPFNMPFAPPQIQPVPLRQGFPTMASSVAMTPLTNLNVQSQSGNGPNGVPSGSQSSLSIPTVINPLNNIFQQNHSNGNIQQHGVQNPLPFGNSNTKNGTIELDITSPLKQYSASPKKIKLHSDGTPAIKRFGCSYCGKRFTLKQNLKVHIRVHTGERPFKCKYCPKKFKDSRARINHHLTHTGEKPHECVVCHKRFGQRSSFTRHLRSQTHKQNEKKHQAQQLPQVSIKSGQ